MLIRQPLDIRSSEITPKSVYLRRREFIQAAARATIGAAGALTALSGTAAAQTGEKLPNVSSSDLSTTGEELNSYADITTYNNYYEFGTGKDEPARNAHVLDTSPWTVRVDGAVMQERTFDYGDLIRLAPLEERIYRMRCVEGWSMVIPWVGFPLSALLNQVTPTSKAQYVAFETHYDRDIMLSARQAGIAFPYVEGLRLDEALHPLTILAVGLYGEALPNQNGAPIRLVVPWKYGFKGIKTINRIALVEQEPPTTWNIANPREYGFYSNVNPNVDHPRWSQATERRLGEFFRRETLMFNGYADQVASMYSGMDLRTFY